MVSLIKYKNIPLKNKPPTNKNPIPLSVVPPQEALVPLWNSPFYATPDTPTDPQDCDRYPDSPWCGGFPWTWTSIGIDPSIVLDECNVGIEIKLIMGWTILPAHQIVHRKNTPECRLKKPREPKPPTPDPNNPRRFDCNDKYYLLQAPLYEPISLDIVWASPEQYIAVGNQSTSILSDYETLVNAANSDCDFRRTPENENTSRYCEYALVEREPEKDVLSYKIGSSYTTEDENGVRNYGEGTEYIFRYWAYWKDTNQMVGGFIVGGEVEGIRNRTVPYEAYYVVVDQYAYTVKLMRYGHYEYFNREHIQVNARLEYIRSVTIEEVGFKCLAPLPFLPPPPPPLEKCDCTMTCCPSTDQNDQLIRLLMKKVDKLSSIVGVDDYPVSLPTSLISKDEGFFGNLIPNVNQDVPSLTRFLAWYVSRFDEIMGQWEIPIEIKDSDPSKPGDQPLGIKLPNMAEAIAEMFTLVFQTNLNSETLLNFAVRTAAETVTDKQQNFITYKLLQSMTEWAGYKQKDIKLKMPTLFSLGKTRYDEILNESEIDVPCVDFDDKFGLEADLMRFREAVSILQANYKRKVDPSGDVKAQILKHLLETFAAVNKVSGEDDDEDFTQFLTDVENGFINQPGASNPTEPYGRPYTERPRIRDLTNYEPPTNP